MLRENFHLVQITPQTDGVLLHLALTSLFLIVTEECSKVAGETVISQENQETLCELKTAGKLIVDLVDTVKKQQEHWKHSTRTGVMRPELVTRLYPLSLNQSLETMHCPINRNMRECAPSNLVMIVFLYSSRICNSQKF